LVALWPLPVLAGWVGYVLAFNPTDRVADPTGPRVWHMIFHVDGPTCGITRMSWYLLHGDLVHAAQSHLLALVAVPVLGYGYVWWAAAGVAGLRLPARASPGGPRASR
jgi:hypothetical protein